MPDSIDKLCALLDQSGLRATFDPRRDCTAPCWLCGAPAAPAHALVSIGTYHNGTDISRPFCAGCKAIYEARVKHA
ncbi:MAG: hypothetical protein V1755_05725 [Chloroflexota bacterium]